MAPRQLGDHGLSPFVEQLGYTDANNLWLVPIAHASLFGIVKNFWEALLAKGKGKHLADSFVPMPLECLLF